MATTFGKEFMFQLNALVAVTLVITVEHRCVLIKIRLPAAGSAYVQKRNSRVYLLCELSGRGAGGACFGLQNYGLRPTVQSYNYNQQSN